MHTFCAFLTGSLYLLTSGPIWQFYQQSYPQSVEQTISSQNRVVTALLKTYEIPAFRSVRWLSEHKP